MVSNGWQSSGFFGDAAGLKNPQQDQLKRVNAYNSPGAIELAAGVGGDWARDFDRSPQATAQQPMSFGQQPQQQNDYLYVGRSPYTSLHTNSMNTTAPALNNWLTSGYMNGPSALTGQINDTIGQQTAMNMSASQRNSDRALEGQKLGLLKDLLSGSMGGSGNLTGFQDTNSRQGGSLNASYTTPITQQALPREAITGATNGIQQANVGMPTFNQPMPASNSLAQGFGDNARIAQFQAGTGAERQLTEANQGLRSNIQQQNAGLGLGQAGQLAGMYEDQTRRQMAMRSPVLQALLGSIA